MLFWFVELWTYLKRVCNSKSRHFDTPGDCVHHRGGGGGGGGGYAPFYILSLTRDVKLYEGTDSYCNKTPTRAYPWNAHTVNTNCPVIVNFNYR